MKKEEHPIEKTKDHLFLIAKTWANLDTESLKNILKENGFGKFDPEMWDNYIKIINDHVNPRPVESPPCEICGGKMVSRRRYAAPFSFVCENVPIHTSAVSVASMMMGFDRTITRKDALLKAMGNPCKHAIPMAQCRECCMEELAKKEAEIMAEEAVLIGKEK